MQQEDVDDNSVLAWTRVEYVRKRVGKVMGTGKGGGGGGGGSVLVHVGTNDADKVGTTELLESYQHLVRELKDMRVGRIVLSAILPVVGWRNGYRNSRNMATNSQLQRMCEMEKVGFVDIWCSFVGGQDLCLLNGQQRCCSAQPDIIGITETWTRPDMGDAEFTLPGCIMFRNDRKLRRAGGVIMYISDT